MTKELEQAMEAEKRKIARRRQAKNFAIVVHKHQTLKYGDIQEPQDYIQFHQEREDERETSTVFICMQCDGQLQVKMKKVSSVPVRCVISGEEWPPELALADVQITQYGGLEYGKGKTT